MGEPPTKRISVTREAGDGEKCRRQESFGILTGGETDLFRGRGQPLALQTRLTIAFSGGQVYGYRSDGISLLYSAQAGAFPFRTQDEGRWSSVQR